MVIVWFMQIVRKPIHNEQKSDVFDLFLAILNINVVYW